MIVSFRDAPIRKKFVAIILLTSGLVLAGSSIVFVANEALSFRTDARKALTSAATVIGRNSVAAVKVGDAKVAHESLQRLRGNDSILTAYLLTGDSRYLGALERAPQLVAAQVHDLRALAGTEPGLAIAHPVVSWTRL